MAPHVDVHVVIGQPLQDVVNKSFVRLVVFEALEVLAAEVGLKSRIVSLRPEVPLLAHVVALGPSRVSQVAEVFVFAPRVLVGMLHHGLALQLISGFEEVHEFG